MKKTFYRYPPADRHTKAMLLSDVDGVTAGDEGFCSSHEDHHNNNNNNVSHSRAVYDSYLVSIP